MSSPPMSLSQKLTLGYAVGGVIGYVKSGSQKSLAAGSVSSALLFYVYAELPVRPTFAAALGLGLSTALLGMMGSRFKKTGKFFPAGLEATSTGSSAVSTKGFHALSLKIMAGDELSSMLVMLV
ncbi:hypothetical protein ACLOJK_019582 [Asimina triloba]